MSEEFIKADIQNRLYEAGLFRAGERIVLVVDNYALLEYFTGKMFSYRMVELDSLTAKHLFSRIKPVSAGDYQRVLAKMNGYMKPVSVQSGWKDSNHERAMKFLVHIFMDVLPQHGMVFRESQLSLALLMLQTVQENKVALCEAEVGTGKTHAYILAMVVHKLFSGSRYPVILSTSTLALQKAVVEEYLPQISEILLHHRITDRELTFVVRKGKSHYVCYSRLKTYLFSLIHNNVEEEQQLIDILDKLFSGKYSIDLDKLPITDYVKRKICVEHCSPGCEFATTCRYQRYIRRVQSGDCDFQIANHNLVVADVLSQKAGRRRLLPEYGAIIIDEAHKLPDVARQMYGIEFESGELEVLVDSVFRQAKYMTSGKTEIYELGEELMQKNQILFNRLSVWKSKGSVMELSAYMFCYLLLSRLAVILRRLSLLFYTKDRRMNAIGKLLSRMEQKQDKLDVLLKKEQSIYWLETVGVAVKICALPKQLDFLLYQDVWKRDIPHVLTSGTISVNGDYKHFKNRTGINFLWQGRVLTASKRSPFDYQNHALLYLPKTLPEPDVKSEWYINAVVQHIRKLVEQTCGHTLVLFTAYRLMEVVFKRLADMEMPYPLFMMGKGRLDTIKQFRDSDSGNGILLASDSAGEGIDLPGDILSSLIIVKLPFPLPDPVLEYEESLYADFHEYFKVVIMPAMLIKLRQWFGRGIRREMDTCVFSILDSRVERRYQREVLAALPEMPVTHEIEDVGRFIREKKSEDYFI
ncbi:MAG: ATP-dependent DNA helicase [Lachnospiraceae bacterium]